MELHRSFNNRIIAGVCSGLAESMNVDPIITRFLFGISIFWGGAGILVYLLLWILLPLMEFPETSKNVFYRPSEGRLISGVCRGISNTLKIDVSIIRLCWIFATIYFGYGIFLYALLWIITPSEHKIRNNGDLND